MNYLRLACLAIALLMNVPVLASKQAFFGDLHIHTSYSMDAYGFGTRMGPDEAYRFAKGAAITHPQGFTVQLDTPLDFYAVTDHAEYLGALTTFDNPDHPLFQAATELGILDESTVAERGRTHPDMPTFVAKHNTLAERRSAWQDIVAAAETHYEPGKLTTFIGYEYTSFRERGNMHRNVIFASNRVPTDIFGRLESKNPEALWRWMDEQRDQGFEVLAIPHNSNGSDGWMFDDVQWDGSPIDPEYAALRLRNEPLVEITQIKGTSETHPFLSPNDEWANFEIFPYRIANWGKSKPRGSYVRDAYLTGLRLEAESGANPYKFGIVGASDTHNSGSRFDEETFVGKVGALDAKPERRGSVPTGVNENVPEYRHVFRINYGAAGLTGVWAEENNRSSIYAALRRKETFATSGTRIRLRMGASTEVAAGVNTRPDWTAAVSKSGVLQGGELAGGEESPFFVVQAEQDARGAPLQRLQIIKGWYADGRQQEAVFDIACSDGLTVATDHRCPDNGASVDLAKCAISADKGDATLSATWQDPTYESGQKAFYYARVLENPTCRWSTWDSVRAGVAPRSGWSTTIQERAWSSPIWVN